MSIDRSHADRVSVLDLAHVIRSKNSGPYELSLDIVFKDPESYRLAVGSGVLTRELFAGLYGIDVDQVLNLIFFEEACAVKATIARLVVSGDIGDTDVYGAQQHAPLLGISFPGERSE